METLSKDNVIYNASLILNYVINNDSEKIDEFVKTGGFCNAIRLCLGKIPYKTSAEYREVSMYDFLVDKNASNDVY